MKKSALIRFDGFYISTKQYMVVDTPVFDEIREGIRVIQFFSNDSQKEGFVSIAELGELENHPHEVNIKNLGKHVRSHIQDVPKEEQEAFWYTIQKPKIFAQWFDVLDTQIFHNKKDPNSPSRKFLGKYTINSPNKIMVHKVKNNGTSAGDPEIYADGQISEESLSLVYHYGERDWVSVFKFVPFDVF